MGKEFEAIYGKKWRKHRRRYISHKPSENAKKEWLPVFQAVATTITAIVAVLGIWLSYNTLKLSQQESEHSRKAAEQQFEANQQESRSKRFSSAIEYLKDSALHIRMGALFELKKLGLEAPEDQESIVRILAPFIRNGIENEKLLMQSTLDKDRKQPNEDVFLACEITSLFWEQSQLRADLSFLNAPNLSLSNLNLQGANLFCAHLQGAFLYNTKLQGVVLFGTDLLQADLRNANLQGADLQYANLQGAVLHDVDLQGADLNGASLQGAADLRWLEDFAIEQFLDTWIDDTTQLPPELSDDPRIQARIEEIKELIAEREADAQD